MNYEEGNKVDLSNNTTILFFEQPLASVNHEEEPPFHLHENGLINHRDAAETATEIIAAKQHITDMVLCRYLKQRKINKNVADKYCHEIEFKFSNKDAKHTIIGFKNNAGGYELKNEYFKLSSSPKYITYITNDKQNRDTKKDFASNHFNSSNELRNKDRNELGNLSCHSSIVSQIDVAKSSFKSDVKDKIKEQNSVTKKA